MLRGRATHWPCRGARRTKDCFAQLGHPCVRARATAWARHLGTRLATYATGLYTCREPGPPPMYWMARTVLATTRSSNTATLLASPEPTRPSRSTDASSFVSRHPLVALHISKKQVHGHVGEFYYTSGPGLKVPALPCSTITTVEVHGDGPYFRALSRAALHHTTRKKQSGLCERARRQTQITSGDDTT